VSLLAAAATPSSGCGSGDEDEGPPPPHSVDVVIYPENGHPIRTATEDAPLLAVEDELARLTNDHRASLGLAALAHLPAVRETARGHSKHMAVHGFYAHLNPEGDQVGNRLTAVGHPWRSAGENLVVERASAEEAFQAWLDSPGHRANLEKAKWRQGGMGFWRGGPYGTYYTQNFVEPPP
jgi:uncharacterized protein YkwD